MTDYFVSYLAGGGTQHSYGSVVISLPKAIATKSDIANLTRLVCEHAGGRPAVVLNIIPLPITAQG